MTAKAFSFFAPWTNQSWDSILALLAAQNCKQNGTALASAARTATTQSAEINAQAFRGITVEFDISAVTGAASVFMRIGVSRLDGSASYANLYVGSALTTTGTRYVTIYPGIATYGSFEGANYCLFGNKVRIEIVHGTADSITYAVRYHLLP